MCTISGFTVAMLMKYLLLYLYEITQYWNDVTSNFNETLSDTLLIVTTSFHLCEFEGIKMFTFPMIPNNAIR